jgi:hypothetical protein
MSELVIFGLKCGFLVAILFREEIGHNITEAKLESSPRPFERPQPRDHTSHVTLVICVQSFPIDLNHVTMSKLVIFGFHYIRTL